MVVCVFPLWGNIAKGMHRLIQRFHEDSCVTSLNKGGIDARQHAVQRSELLIASCENFRAGVVLVFVSYLFFASHATKP